MKVSWLVLAFLLLLLLLLGWSDVFAAQPESYYRDLWCEDSGGQAEFRLPDGSRVDCLTKNYAVEVDFARKWAEAVGQSLWYAANTGRMAKIVLIVDHTDNSDMRRLERLEKLIWHYGLPVDVETIDKSIPLTGRP